MTVPLALKIRSWPYAPVLFAIPDGTIRSRGSAFSAGNSADLRSGDISIQVEITSIDGLVAVGKIQHFEYCGEDNAFPEHIDMLNGHGVGTSIEFLEENIFTYTMR